MSSGYIREPEGSGLPRVDFRISKSDQVSFIGNVDRWDILNYLQDDLKQILDHLSENTDRFHIRIRVSSSSTKGKIVFSRMIQEVIQKVINVDGHSGVEFSWEYKNDRTQLLGAGLQKEYNMFSGEHDGSLFVFKLRPLLQTED